MPLSLPSSLPPAKSPVNAAQLTNSLLLSPGRPSSLSREAASLLLLHGLPFVEVADRGRLQLLLFSTKGLPGTSPLRVVVGNRAGKEKGVQQNVRSRQEEAR